MNCLVINTTPFFYGQCSGVLQGHEMERKLVSCRYQKKLDWRGANGQCLFNWDIRIFSKRSLKANLYFCVQTAGTICVMSIYTCVSVVVALQLHRQNAIWW